MSTGQMILIMLAFMAVGLLARALPENVKEVAAIIGGLAAFLGIILMVIWYFTDIGILMTIGIFLVAPAFAAFVGTAILENTENAWNLGRSAGQPDPRKDRTQQKQTTGVKWRENTGQLDLFTQNQVTASDGSVKEAQKTAKQTSTGNQANS